MLYYVLKINHDNGSLFLKTCARNSDTAIENAMKVESCPRCAIEGIYEIPRGLFSMDASNIYKNFITK